MRKRKDLENSTSHQVGEIKEIKIGLVIGQIKEIKIGIWIVLEIVIHILKTETEDQLGDEMIGIDLETHLEIIQLIRKMKEQEKLRMIPERSPSNMMHIVARKVMQ